MSRRWTSWVLGASLGLLAMSPVAMSEPETRRLIAPSAPESPSGTALRPTWGLIAPSAPESPLGTALRPMRGLIVPGKAIGPVALGATLDEVKVRIGQPDDVRAIDAERALMQWREHSLVVGFEQDRVVLVGTNSNQYRTSTGLQVGVPGANALRLFPGLTPPAVKGLFGLCDDTMGINFLTHPVDEHGAPLQAHTLPEGWLIDEINIYRSPGERVIAPAAPESPFGTAWRPVRGLIDRTESES